MYAQAAKAKLNGATLSKDMQMLMGANPDFTTILNEGMVSTRNTAHA